MGSAKIYYYHTDHLGSSSVITDETATKVQSLTYFPYGQTRTSTGSIDVHHKYTSQELDDSTGLYFYNARYYDPALGRFVSADSIIPNPRDPQALNRYSYVRNNPIIYTDPSGHRWKWLDKQMDRLRENERFQVVVGVSLQALGGGFFVPGSALLTQSETGRRILVGEVIIGEAIVTGYYCSGCTLQIGGGGAAGSGSASAAISICTGCTGGIPLSYIGAALFGGGGAAGLSPGGSGSSNSSDTPEGGGTQVAGNFVIPCPNRDCSYMKEHQYDILIGGPLTIVIDELIAGSQLIKATNSLIQYERSGGFSEALRWFKALATDYGAVVKESSKTEGVYFFKTPGGIEGEVRSFSKYGSPTLTIRQPAVPEIKFRFLE